MRYRYESCVGPRCGQKLGCIQNWLYSDAVKRVGGDSNVSDVLVDTCFCLQLSVEKRRLKVTEMLQRSSLWVKVP